MVQKTSSSFSSGGMCTSVITDGTWPIRRREQNAKGTAGWAGGWMGFQHGAEGTAARGKPDGTHSSHARQRREL